MNGVTALLGALKGLWWPLAAVIIAVVYKSELRSLIPRLRKAGPTGVEFDPADAQKTSAAEASTAIEPGKLKEFPGIMRTPAIERVERQLHAALNTINMKEEEKPDFLVRLLAQAQLEAAFERIYRVIFGSQILGLRRLSERGRVTVEEAQEFFRTFENQYPEFYKGYNFDGWLRFLIDNGLVIKNNGMLEITELGRDFLIYITARRLPENKLG